MRKFLKIQSELSVQSTNKKNFLIDNHYKIIFKSVRNACTSYRVSSFRMTRGSRGEIYVKYNKTFSFVHGVAGLMRHLIASFVCVVTGKNQRGRQKDIKHKRKVKITVLYFH